jgi:hypothetical protein
MSRRRKHAWYRLLGESHDVTPAYSARMKFLLVLTSLVMSVAVWYHVYTERSNTAAIHVHPAEEDFEAFEDYTECDMPGPCWGENPPVDCECY